MNEAKSTRQKRMEPKPKTGIVHLGLGAFFRAHGAVYIAEAMKKSGGDWGVAGVSLRSGAVRDRLAPSNGVYLAVEVSAEGLQPQRIDVVTDVLVAPEDPEAVMSVMTSQSVHLVTLTITEKGYCRGAGERALDLSHSDIAHDLVSDVPRSAIGFLVRALERRRASGMRPFTVLSLDNLPANGSVLKAAVLAFAEELDLALANWIDTDGRFPRSMVDRIVPATAEEDIDRLRTATGYDDPAAVFHEPFRQWVIEDHFVDGRRPDFAAASALLVSDVEPYEKMKLRMLNGSHSTLAYLGSLLGHQTVFQAVHDKVLVRYLKELWAEELATSLEAPTGVDLGEYAHALLMRYRNPEIKHALSQIAMDGSQKLPQRILDPLFENKAAGRSYKRLLTVLAGWITFLRQSDPSEINDPLAGELVLAFHGKSDTRELVQSVLNIGAIFGSYPVERIETELAETLLRIEARGMANAVETITL